MKSTLRNGQAINIVILTMFVLANSIQSINPAYARHHDPQMTDPAGTDAMGMDKWHAAMVPNNMGFPELNVRVANFAVENLGKKIGNGECWTLAQQALIKAGAQRPQGYVFGRELVQGEPWLPGDIIQFTNCQFIDVQPNRRTTITIGTPNHTAIIHSIFNGKVVVLQQNVNHDKHVQTEALSFATMTSGSLKVFQPVPAFNRRR